MITFFAVAFHNSYPAIFFVFLSTYFLPFGIYGLYQLVNMLNFFLIFRLLNIVTTMDNVLTGVN